MDATSQIVDRHNSMVVRKVETVLTGSNGGGQPATRLTEYVVEASDGKTLANVKTLGEARKFIGKAIQHPYPTSKPRSMYRGPAKGPSGGGQAKGGQAKGGKK